ISNLSLDSNVPLLHIRLVRVVIERCKHAPIGIRDIAAQGEWKWIASRFGAKGTVKTASGTGQLNLTSPWRTLRRREIQFRRCHVVEDSVAGADDHLSIFAGIPNESHSRSKVCPSFVDGTRAIRTKLRIAGIENARRRIRVLSRPDPLLKRIHIKSVCLF